jgi:hypothetical protein
LPLLRHIRASKHTHTHIHSQALTMQASKHTNKHSTCLPRLYTVINKPLPAAWSHMHMVQ